MKVDSVFDIFNLNTYGEEIELVYRLLLKKLIKNLKKGRFSILIENPETLRLMGVDELMEKIYGDPKKFPKGQFYPLIFLRSLGIFKLVTEEKQDFIYINKNFISDLQSPFSSAIQENLPLSCIILEQFAKLANDDTNKNFYYTIRKIIYENRFFRYTGPIEVGKIQERNPTFEIKNFELSLNEAKYGFFRNIVNYFYFEEKTYKFNQRFIRDLLVYFMWKNNHLKSEDASERFQKLISTIEDNLIKLSTQSPNDKIFKGFILGLLEYEHFSQEIPDFNPKLKLSHKGDIGNVYDIDKSTKIDFFKLKFNGVI
ncbi:MAG: hypothetical protein ACTSP3_00020 [Candidatus Heimdallarchaeaceae archaeon]